ncbi:hypothetical protein D3C72_1216460 [compost metagenome]
MKVIFILPLTALMFSISCNHGVDKDKVLASGRKYFENSIAEGGKIQELEIFDLDTLNSSSVAYIHYTIFTDKYKQELKVFELNKSMVDLKASSIKLSSAFGRVSKSDMDEYNDAYSDLESKKREIESVLDSINKYDKMTDTASKTDVKGYEAGFRIKYLDKRGVTHTVDTFYLQFNPKYEIESWQEKVKM